MWLSSLEGIFLVAVALCALSHDAQGLEFANLDSGAKFNVSWTYDETDITFTLHVATTGWVGFGFSPNGAMINSDIVYAERVGESWTITDSHTTTSKVKPTRDAEQDWTLISGQESNGVTTIQMSRKRVICRGNGEDMSISTDTMRLIYAYGSTPSVEYHGFTNRGTKSLYLLVADSSDIPSRPANAVDHDFIRANVAVPTKPTTYWCTLFPMPTVTQKSHVISFEPIVQPGNELYVHHILVYGCYNGINGSEIIAADDQSHECFTPNMPADMNSCRKVLFAWAIGGGKFSFPSEAGLAIGSDRSPTYVVMETHYDNPNGNAGIVDSSGLRITYTETLRTYDIDILEIGSVEGILVPPQRPMTDIAFMCSGGCTGDAFPEAGITVFAGLLHSHLLGRKITVRHTRSNGTSGILIRDHAYDFNFQEARHFDDPVVVNNGDSLQITCGMDSSSRSGPTYGGLGTTEEMCIAFLYSYPPTDLGICGSIPIVLQMPSSPAKSFYRSLGVSNETVEGAGSDLGRVTRDIQWTTPNGQTVADSYLDYDHYSWCIKSSFREVFSDHLAPIEHDIFSRTDNSANTVQVCTYSSERPATEMSTREATTLEVGSATHLTVFCTLIVTPLAVLLNVYN